MISIVIIAFSTIAVTVFSDEDTVKPEHIPHTDLQENFNRSAKTIQIVHSGGEAIDESDIKIILYANGEKKGEFQSGDFTVKNPYGMDSSDEVFTLGDCIEIDTESMELKAGEDIDIFFVDKPSEQVIQKAVLQRGIVGGLPYWITPHPYGSVYSSITGGWLPTELVGAFNDSVFTTEKPIPKRPEFVYEEFQFGIDADEMGISDPLKLVQLNVVYSSKDCSPDEIPLSVYNGSNWTQIGQNMKENCNFTESSTVVYDISSEPSYVNTTEKLEKLVVKFSASGNANENSDKYYCVDCVRIHVELF